MKEDLKLGKFSEGEYVKMLFRNAQGTWNADHLRHPGYAEHDGERAWVVGSMVLDDTYLYTVRVSADVELRGIPEGVLRALVTRSANR